MNEPTKQEHHSGSHHHNEHDHTGHQIKQDHDEGKTSIENETSREKIQAHGNQEDMQNHVHSSHETMDHNHDSHTGHIEGLRKKFFICLILAIPVFFLSPMMGVTLPFQFSFPGGGWIVLVLSTILYFYGGMPFLKGAKKELEVKNPGMMTLISLGISTSYLYSLYAFAMNTFFHGAHVMDFFWELATLIVIMLLGHWIEMKAVAGAGDALKKIAELLPSQAYVKQKDGNFTAVMLRDLMVGQIVIVKAGEKIPADGIIQEGRTTINESMVTGESREVPKQQNDKVIGGSLNGNGSILIKVTGTGESGYLAQVMQMVSSAQHEKSKAETLSGKVAQWLFYAALFTAVITIVVWFAISHDIGKAVTYMVTVLVIACPHALGLAIPLVIARSTSLGAKNGLLVRDRKALEIAPKVNTVLLDKTGTLTEGNFKVIQVLSFDEHYTEDDILTLASALETASSHPLGFSILRKAAERKLKPLAVRNVKTLPGIGLSGTLENGQEISIVNAAYLDNHGVPYPETPYHELSAEGYSLSFLVLTNKALGLIAQGDEIKPGANQLIENLKQRNITPVMLSGDNKAAAEKIAAVLGITEVHAGLLPEDKEKMVKKYHEEGNATMMVGDGVNDAPSLARADVGVAIGAGTDIAIDSADVVLVKSDPLDIIHFLSLAKNTTRKMVQNLWWGAGYNIIAIPLAAGVLAPAGILLNPAAGAVLMSLSTIIVAINALTFRMK